jgi:hypothetical protein
MAKARRKMRRQLMKKLKKGYLTPGEREDLMQLDREVNRANRQAAGMTGAGLGSALLIASKMGAGDALGDWLDTRQNKKELEAEKEAVGEITADQIEQENANTLVEQAREEMKDESAEAPDSLDIEEIDEKEDGSDWREKQREYDKLERQRGVESGRRIGFAHMTEAMGEKTADQIAQENAIRLIQQAIEEMKDGSVEIPDTLNIEEIDEKEEDFKEDWGKRQREYDKLERQRGVESGRRISFDAEYPAGPPLKEQAGPRAEESDEYRVPMAVDLPEYPLDMLIRMQESAPFPDKPTAKEQREYDKLERQRGVESGRMIGFDRMYPAGPPVREQAGPRVEEQAQGGYTPFLRAVRDRMRKKYGSR